MVTKHKWISTLKWWVRLIQSYCSAIDRMFRLFAIEEWEFTFLSYTQKTTSSRFTTLNINLQSDTKKRELLKNPTKIEEIQEKKIVDRNWTITTCLLRDSNPYYQCLKITYCRWRRPTRMHSFTATTLFKFPVLLCHSVCVACSAECAIYRA